MYDKHQYSVLRNLFAIFDNTRVRHLLHDIAARDDEFAVVDIGPGAGLRYTGQVLYALVRSGVAGHSIHLVDPALCEYRTRQALADMQQCFPAVRLHVHPHR